MMKISSAESQFGEIFEIEINKTKEAYFFPAFCLCSF